MPGAEIEVLDPLRYRRIPWKNGQGFLTVIAAGGGEGWDGDGIAWHFGRTQIASEGPFSDLAGYDRLQVVIQGRGLVLVTPTGEIDLRQPFLVQRYDGGTPITTRLESGTVEVVNLIADRRRFDIDLRVAAADASVNLAAGLHLVHSPSNSARISVDGREIALAENQAVHIRIVEPTSVMVLAGRALVGSIFANDDT